MVKKYSYIPTRLKNAAENDYVAGAEDILDDVLNKTQEEINGIVLTPSTGIDDRLKTIENGVRFEGTIQTEGSPANVVSQGAKVTTANAVRGAIDVRTGYFKCTTASGTAKKTASAPGYVLSRGGAMKIWMEHANTIDNATLDINSTGEKALFYNDDRAGSNNSWEDGEVISVYYDETANSNAGAYFASNAQGGGGKFRSGEKVKDVGITDNVTVNDDNLVTSGGVAEHVNDTLFGSTEVVNDIDTTAGNVNCWIDGNGNWYLNHNQKGVLIVCKSDWLGKQLIVQGSSSYMSKVAFLKSNTITDGRPADYCIGENNRHDIDINATVSFTIPNDCTHIWFAIGTIDIENAYRPKSVVIKYDNNGIIPQIENRIDALEQKSVINVPVDLSELKDENWYYYIGSDNADAQYSKTSGTASHGNTGVFYPLKYKAKKLYVEGSDIYTSKVAFLKSQRGDEPEFCEGETRRTIAQGASGTFDIPNDCKYIWFAIGSRLDQTAYNADDYRPKKVTLLDVTFDDNRLESPNDNRTYGIKNDLLNPLNNVFGVFDYIRCESQEAIPVGSSAVSYADFIAQWDAFVGQHSEFSEKEEIIKSTTGNYSIYKYVYTPAYYEKTIFLTAGMHGDEYEGFWGLLRCMQYILENGNKNDIIGYIKHRCRIIIIPVLNPYGVQNKIRYSTSQNNDQNYNFDVAWGKLCNVSSPTQINVTGSSPFYYAEPKAVKIVCDEYDGEISFHIDFHTDPYNSGGLPANTSKCNYIEADEDSIIFPAAYRLTLDEREHIKNDLNFQNISSNFVVWTNKAATSFRYMEWVRHIPSIIVETTTYASNKSGSGFAGVSGSADVMKVTVDWYLNCICMMLTNVL